MGSTRCDGFANNHALPICRWVMLTGSEDGREEANTAYQVGASSFFVKSLDFANAAELSPGLGRAKFSDLINEWH
jgi:hypothetical protein